MACVSRSGETYGDEAYYNQVSEWCSYFDSDCSCSEANSISCFFYNGPIAADSCDNILVEYTNSLKGAVALDAIATVAVFMISVVTCVSLCTASSSGTTVVIPMTAPQQVFVQPQQQMQGGYGQVPGGQVQYQQQFPGQVQYQQQYTQAVVVDQPKAF